MFSCQYGTKSICLDIQNKMNVLERLHLLVRTLNMNDNYNEEKVCGISTKLIRKFMDFFIIIIGGKPATNLPLNKAYYLRKMAKKFLYGPMYLSLHDYPQYPDKNKTFLRQTLTNNSDVFMDIQIMMNIMY